MFLLFNFIKNTSTSGGTKLIPTPALSGSGTVDSKKNPLSQVIAQLPKII